jgi:hypothetical protein
MERGGIMQSNLTKGERLQIQDGHGQCIRVISGLVGITQEHNWRSVVLVSGESFTLDCPGNATILARDCASVQVIAPEFNGSNRLLTETLGSNEFGSRRKRDREEQKQCVTSRNASSSLLLDARARHMRRESTNTIARRTAAVLCRGGAAMCGRLRCRSNRGPRAGRASRFQALPYQAFDN